MMKDIENKASYEDSYRGIGYTYDRKYETIMGKAKDHLPISDEERTYVNDRYNRMGLVPDLGMPSSDSVTSTTQSAIAPGILLVTNEHLDPATVNRNTKDTLNALDAIFDKKKIDERQELAKLFAKNANEAIHKISESKGWEDGSKEKIALHTLVSGITAQLGGQPFADGAIAGGVNEAAVGKLMDAIGKDNPDMVQIASAVLGYATNKLAGKDGEAGAAVAQWGTKWNRNLESYLEKYMLDDPVYFSDEGNREQFRSQFYEIIKGSVETTLSSGIANGIIHMPAKGKANIYTQRIGIGPYTEGMGVIIAPDAEQSGQYRVYVGFEDSIGAGWGNGSSIGQISLLSPATTNNALDNTLAGWSYSIGGGAGGFASISNFFNENPTATMEIEVSAGVSLSYSEYEHIMNIDERGNRI